MSDAGIAAAFTRDDVQNGIRQHGPSAPLSALRTEGLAYPHVHPDHILEDALDRMEDVGVPAAAVLERSDVRHVCGMVTLTEVRAAFRR